MDREIWHKPIPIKDIPNIRIITLVVVFLISNIVFLFFNHQINYIVNLYLGIPVILSTYYYGFFTGFGLMVLNVGLHLLILYFLGEDTTVIYEGSRVKIAFISLIVVVFIVSQFRKTKIALQISENRYKSQSEELRRINATKDKFFSIIAHDLRSPMGLISTNLNILVNSKYNLTEKEKDELLYRLQSISTKVFNLLENLLKWALLQRGEMKFKLNKVDILDTISDSIRLLHYLAQEKNITIINKIPENIYVLADKNALEAIIRNLISNAIKFTNNNGTVTLQALDYTDKISVSVIDNGVGIEPELLNKLFRVDQDIVNFGTTGEKGTGIGLALCYEMITQMNGSIKVESHPKHGSTFTFDLPKCI